MKRRSTCLCTKLQLVHDGEIDKSSICHCNACQKRTGSTYGAQVVLAKNKVSILGEFQIYNFTSDEGNLVKFHFCPNCATTLFWEITFFPDHYVAALGCFDDANIAAPTFSVYEDRKHSWVILPDSITEHVG
ncbi:MAG: GFA family protein [Candidatus Cloacimonetes bacterium]|nr:GFA family protein [Candidatus Cloacimonadota bacterium]